MPEALIFSALRTAEKRRAGALYQTRLADLAGKGLNGLIGQMESDPGQIDDVILDCVGPSAEQIHNIARSAVLSSRLPEGVPGTIVDRQCGPSQQGLHFTAQAVMSGAEERVIAAGLNVCPGYRFPIEVLQEDASVGLHSIDEGVPFGATLAESG